MLSAVHKDPVKSSYVIKSACRTWRAGRIINMTRQNRYALCELWVNKNIVRIIPQTLGVPFAVLVCLTGALRCTLDLLKHDLAVLFWRLCNLNPFKTNLMGRGYRRTCLDQDYSSRLKIKGFKPMYICPMMGTHVDN